MLLKIIISFHHGVDPVVQDLPNGPKGVVAQLAREAVASPPWLYQLLRESHAHSG